MFRYISTIRKKVNNEMKTFVKVYTVDKIRVRDVVKQIKAEFGLDNFIQKGDQVNEGIRNLRSMDDNIELDE